MKRTVVTVTFDGDREYTYLTDIEGLEIGDWVVTDSSNGLGVANVVRTKGIENSMRSKATKWLVQKIDMDAHDARMHRAEIENEIRLKLRERKEQAEEFLIYQTMAKHDPEIKNLLGQLESLTGENLLAAPDKDKEGF